MQRITFWHVAVIALIAFVQKGYAEQAIDPLAALDIGRFEVEGDTLLNRKTLNVILGRFTGKGRSQTDIQQAIEALEGAYRQRGYPFAQIVQDDVAPRAGIVRLHVTQLRMGKTLVNGHMFHDEANIRRSLPHYVEGAIPNTNDLATDIRVANENPSKKVTPQLQIGETTGSIDAALSVVDEKTWSAGAVLDNSGVDLPGRTHITAQYENFNLWDRDHILSLQYTTSTEHPSDIRVFGVGYHIPLYASGGSLDLYGSYSDVNTGSIAAGLLDLTVSGAGSVFGLHYAYSLPQLGLYDSELIVALDHKAFHSVINAADRNLGGDVTVNPASLSYTGHWISPARSAGVWVTAVRNITGGSQSEPANFSTARTGATPTYSLLRYGAGLTQTLPQDWTLRGAANGQATHAALVPGEQFGVGGASSVRGLQERDVQDDNGITLNLELYTPELCRRSPSVLTRCNLLGFVDDARTSRNDPQPGEERHESVDSAGLGFRLTRGPAVTLQLDYGQVFRANDPLLKGDRRLHALLAVSF